MARSEIGRTGARFGAPPSRHAPDPEYPHGRPPEPDPEPTVVAEEPESEPENLVGVTGARFGGHSAKRTRLSRRERAARRAAARAESAGHPADDTTVGGTATGDPAAADTGRGPDGDTGTPGPADTAPLPVVSGRPAPGPGRPAAAAGPASSPPAPRHPAPQLTAPPDAAPLEVPAFAPVRPYVMTGGRTRVRAELRLETLVSVRPAPGPVPRADSVERAAVLRLCTRPRSVSEVAALAAVPLGVARVLIDDLASEGRLVVHGVSSAEDGPSVALMDRVLAGLRRL
ncbi:DUF742 domain-containing protein [Pseudonocardia alni]|jgi:hypothetical protein|uniref:DUF742 domain-containing protein n=3 Tax=Pseudonocardia TaxID=1847 RepID=A0A852VX34_PSEA5|nr:DUF742 domain-containing protein [Pseudonocardia antarctica]NYF99900.1 hypothetical protein [Pseudonocardia antarctica]